MGWQVPESCIFATFDVRHESNPTTKTCVGGNMVNIKCYGFATFITWLFW